MVILDRRVYIIYESVRLIANGVLSQPAAGGEFTCGSGKYGFGQNTELGGPVKSSPGHICEAAR